MKEQREWITDRKPGDGDTNVDGVVLVTTIYHFLAVADWDEHNQCWWINDRQIPQGEILAWTKLPDPYDERLGVQA